ncbi:MAG TPA: pyridoxal-dependent decarboxylase, partial [Gemmatimonadaceae bacterium]
MPDILSAIEADCDADVARAFVAVAADYMKETRSREGRVSTLHSPAELAARFDEPLPREPRSIETVIRRLQSEVVPDCNHLYHPRYVGHQVSAPLPAAVWTDALVSALNQSTAVFEMSPVGTVIEHRVVRWMADLAGFGERAGGTMTTGGTEATFTAMLAARSAVVPDAWTNGVGADPPLLLCGEHAHYAVTRAAGELGLGMRSVMAIPSRHYRMDVDALGATLADVARGGKRVMAVIATAGSTATGSFDDLAAIGALCDEYGVWLHVDGAHGASALLSQKHRHRVRGIERARSIAWDPHKMMLLPLQAGMVLLRDERDLDGAFSQRAPYLF